MNTNTTTTANTLTFERDDRRTIVYAEGRGVLGRIVPVGAAFSATLYTDGANGPTRLFSTHRHAENAYKYGF